jgi:lactate dehydrogenase-like 2-hydroxyacid dehydrogenase
MKKSPKFWFFIHPVIKSLAKKLKIVATMSVGYDHVDIEECRKRLVLNVKQWRSQWRTQVALFW